MNYSQNRSSRNGFRTFARLAYLAGIWLVVGAHIFWHLSLKFALQSELVDFGKLCSDWCLTTVTNWHMTFLNMRQCGKFLFNFTFLLCKLLKQWASRWHYLKRQYWHINFSSMRSCDNCLSHLDNFPASSW